MAARSRRGLVVEDDPDVAEVLRDLLTDDGHHVDIAPDGRAALDLIGAAEYDLIFCDLQRPTLDGVGLYGELERRRPDLLRRFIVVSEFLADDRADDFLARTEVPAIAKPYDPADVRRAVTEY